MSDNVVGGGGASGGGVSSVGADAVPEFTGCTVSDNEAGNQGGGIFNDFDAP